SVFEASDYKKFKVKPYQSNLLCLPLDNSMLYTLMINFGIINYGLICKDRYSISSLPISLKSKADAFGSVFDLSCIQELCNSHKLEFIYQVLIGPGISACVINDSQISWKAQKEMPKSQKAVSKQEESKELGGKLSSARNLTVDNEERKIEAAKIKEMKQKGWTEFQSLHKLRCELKDTRSKDHYIRTGQPLGHHSVTTDTDVKAIHSAGQIKFSGSVYGLKTMSVTVEISLEVFSSHLSYYNKLYLKNPLPIKQEVSPQLYPLPKAHKLTSKNINYLCLKNKISYKLEQRKKNTVRIKQH
ncbi:hypothetical protein CU098_003689, partial [Rhizopus stolonifer]